MRGKKLGLALSGGGLRASFFHIGVLAALADQDLLRKVEVISTVSGGSIIGALYSIKVKHLLESKADRHIKPEDFQQLVAELAGEFLEATQKNIRLRAFANPIKNARMARPDYSRSDRIGEVLDSLLYRPGLGKGRGPVLMSDLLINPKTEGSPANDQNVTLFSPDRKNPLRQVKVPILIINATSLNTGRNWRFEAIRMGEPPKTEQFARDVDMRMQLERPPTYDVIETNHRWMRLGHAVAASAAVPGIFHPLAISQLYEGVRVQLVDGGIHDNQGVGALLDRKCDVIVVSDGSSQMLAEAYPNTSIPSVLLRSQEILMSRVREEQLLRAHQAHGNNIYLAHLQKGLPVEYVPYVSTKESEEDRPVKSDETTSQRKRIDPRVQEALGRIRTDIDTFSDAEAFALMRAGYVIAQPGLRSLPGLEKRQAIDPFPWEFNAVKQLMKDPTDAFLRVLRVGSSNSFKVFALYPWLRSAAIAAVVGILAFWGWRFPPDWTLGFRTLMLIAVGLVLMIVPGGLPGAGSRWNRGPWRLFRSISDGFIRVFMRAIPWAVISVGVWLYLLLLNPLYLWAGKLERLQKEPKVKRRPFSMARRM